ncbi:CRPV-015 [Crowpox virus]|nr:CRPV-015 [Crowpox virus]
MGSSHSNSATVPEISFTQPLESDYSTYNRSVNYKYSNDESSYLS